MSGELDPARGDVVDAQSGGLIGWLKAYPLDFLQRFVLGQFKRADRDVLKTRFARIGMALAVLNTKCSKGI